MCYNLPICQLPELEPTFIFETDGTIKIISIMASITRRIYIEPIRFDYNIILWQLDASTNVFQRQVLQSKMCD